MDMTLLEITMCALITEPCSKGQDWHALEIHGNYDVLLLQWLYMRTLIDHSKTTLYICVYSIVRFEDSG